MCSIHTCVCTKPGHKICSKAANGGGVVKESGYETCSDIQGNDSVG